MAKEDGFALVTGEGIAFLPLPLRLPEMVAALSHKGPARSKMEELEIEGNKE